MGARGPHDDFDSAEKLIRRVYAQYNETQDLGPLRRDHIADDLEHVTRNGTFHGPEQFLSEFQVQQEKWRIENEIEEVIDAGDGAIVILAEMRRIDHESGNVDWKAWPAAVVRILDGKLAFFEGYVDRRSALAALGVERG